MSSRLVLGTAQLGMPHGINNAIGQPDPISAKAIVEEAFRQGIIEFDTAQVYGQSETILGQAFVSLKITSQVSVVTKLDPTLDQDQPAMIIKGVQASLERLKVSALSALMLHRQEQLASWPSKLYSALKVLKDEGKVKRFGVSVYTPQAAQEALQMEGIDCVQIPSSILDKRFEKTGIFDLAAAKGKELYVRSVYLQGLILMPPENIPANMRFTAAAITQVKALAEQYNVTLQELCLGYALAKWPKAKIIVGAETVGQIAENAKIARKVLAPALMANADILFTNVDERVVNPLLWPRR